MSSNDTPLTFYLTAAIAIVAAIVGGILVIVNPETLSYEDYLARMGILLGGLGLFAGGAAKAEKKPASSQPITTTITGTVGGFASGETGTGVPATPAGGPTGGPTPGAP